MIWTNPRKPQTHYFERGYVTFSVMRIDQELHYETWKQNKESLSLLESGFVTDETHLNQPLSIKSVDEIPNRNEVVQQ